MPGVKDEVSYVIRDIIKEQFNNSSAGSLNLARQRDYISKALSLIDKKLFIGLRDQKLTLQQVCSRLDAAHRGVSYKVFDDLKPKLNERILNGKIKSEKQLK